MNIFKASPFFIFIMLYAHPSYSGGQIVYSSGIFTHHLELPVSDVNNVIGAQSNSEWDSGSAIPISDWHFNCTSIDSIGSGILYSAEYSFQTISQGGGWYKLDDYWDVSSSVFISGMLASYVDVPFKSVSNGGDTAGGLNQCKTVGKFSNGSRLGTGGKGKLSLRLTKKIINGYTFTSLPILNIAGAINEEPLITAPFTRVVIDSFSINLPEKCEINAGQSIDVDFGDVSTTKLDGNHYPITKMLNVSCSSGDFESGLSTVITQFVGNPTSFSNDYFATDHSGIGIVLKTDDSNIIRPQEQKALNLKDGKNSLPLTFYPVSDTSNVDAGEFNASIVVRLLIE